jgi:cohesin loading factor subunit SCC2
LAYLVIMLNNHFCKNFNRILQYLIQSCSSDQPRVRTRSLKSVTQMIEKDHSLLERIPQLKGLMRNCVVDSSTTVRDNALVLIAKCIESRPAMEIEWVGPILQCSRDSVVGIRKRAIRILRDIYLRQMKKEEASSTDLRGVVAKGLLQCVDDLDEGTAELAKQTMEEVWLGTFVNLVQDDSSSIQHRVALLAQMSLVIETIQRETSHQEAKLSDLLETFLKYTMSTKSKAHEQNTKICKTFVGLGFDGIIDSSELPGQPEQRLILQTLVSFAHANPKLFTQQQLSHLQPYIRDLSSSEDVLLFKAIVMIYRSVLPILPSVQKDFLKTVQEDLLKNVTKLGRPELNEAAACLWTINTVLENIERLVNLVISVLKKLHNLEGKNIPATDLTPQQQQETSTIQRLILIAGCFGQHCNFQSQLAKFKAATPWLQGDMVAGKIVGAIKAFTRPQLPVSLRQTAFDGMGMVCQRWPLVFTQADIARIFQQVLRSDATNLQKIILSSFRDFFATQDQQFSSGALSTERDPLSGGKLGGSMTANEHDSAASLISQGFLRDIVRIALNSVDENALTATEVIASITRQGLVHPKECGPALVALETSTNARIAEIAYQQHYNLHQQHESMFEREYMRAIYEAFVYQRDVVKDSKGYTLPTYKAKLHSMYEVVKTSKSKYQGKFLDYYTQKINFDVSKLDVEPEIPPHLAYARFLIENLAFFEFGRIQDAVQALTCMERIVQGSGAGISHSVNTEIFQLSLDAETGAPMQAAEDNAAIDISPQRLRLLTAASMILTMLWEARTFMRHLWNISNKDIRREGKPKGPGAGGGAGTPSKDSTKAPTKNNSITGERLATSITEIWSALNSREASLAQCKRFTDMMTVDSELKVGADSGAEDLDGYDTPTGGFEDDEDDSVIPPSGGSRAKRRGSASIGGTPSKKKRGKPPGAKGHWQSWALTRDPAWSYGDRRLYEIPNPHLKFIL